MSNPGGGDDLLVRARSVLLDALEALTDHRGSVIVIGAQAVYLHTGNAAIAIAEATKDSDLALDVRALRQDPHIDVAMEQAGFVLNPTSNQPGAWISPSGIPVDLMVPEAIAGGRGSRSAIHPPHSKRAMRRAVGLEAAMIDVQTMSIRSLSPNDPRILNARVAGPAALLVAKLHKIAERRAQPGRLNDKDAHDAYRILFAISTAELAASLVRLMDDDLAGVVTEQAMTFLQELFADGPASLGSVMAGRTEEGVGDPETVSQTCAVLAADLVRAVNQVRMPLGD